jgi:hypothetical protein
MNRSGARFLQSAGDFPIWVTLGEKVPVWGIGRWGGAGLRFLPPDDEGFTLRGDKRRGTGGSLVYQGRRRSHRFTILDDTAFEYDCILNREPESNIIILRMEGAENFDFFRQPDFVVDPFLRGSYAVYKKETLIGEGTGKLCHIHRPLIIDDLGRKVFGDLSVCGNELHITIPETWLGEAKYPVVVDPTIGTTTVGSQTQWNNVDNEGYEQLFIDLALGVNRFLLSEVFTGTATAYVYAYDNEYDGRCKPVLYSDNGNAPLTRKSKSEGGFEIAVHSGKPAGWRSTTFQTKETINAGTYIWFGLFCDFFAPRFDYGAKCYWDFWDHLGDDIPDTYPLFHKNSYYDFKLSMYFSYSSGQNYTRTLTQGVTLTDNRRQATTYKRATVMNAQGTTLIAHSSHYYREHINSVNVTGVLGGFRGFFRSIAEQIRTTEGFTSFLDCLRAIADILRPETVETRNLSVHRDIVDPAGIQDSTARSRGIIRTIVAAVSAGDYAGKVFTLFRSIREEVRTLGEAGHFGDYLRGLYTEAGSMAETRREGNYYRAVEDRAGNMAVSLRHLCIFIRLTTLSLVRDYLLSRFLRSRDALVLKSPITRELELDSRID